jgi:hypothetical protein
LEEEGLAIESELKGLVSSCYFSMDSHSLYSSKQSDLAIIQKIDVSVFIKGVPEVG